MAIIQEKLTRPEIIAALAQRDGMICQYPGCDGNLDFDATGPKEITIDHWIPQVFGRSNNWTYEEIWHIDNLKLMHKKCNAKKGDRVPHEDGTLPERVERTFRYRRDKRAQRAEICLACNAGRNLEENEWCNACGSGPMPERFPRWKKMRVADCDHDVFFCIGCTVLEPELRRSVLDVLISGGPGYE